MNGEATEVVRRSAQRPMVVCAIGLVALLCFAATAPALPVPEGASILVFPDVTTSESMETIVQISNLGTSSVTALCWYVSGEGAEAGYTPAESEEVVDFDLWLTARQPTQWIASQGRPVDWADGCAGDLRHQGECAGAGFDPGEIPALQPGFAGELLCVEADVAGHPLSGNRLFGQATRIDLESGDVSKYSALRFRGTERQNGDRTLCLGGPVSPSCPHGDEFDACAETWLLSHPAEQPGDTDPAVATRLVIAACSLDLAAGEDELLTVQFQITNEFEQTFSASTSIRRWAAVPLVDVNSIFERERIGSEFLQTRIRVSSGAPSGVLVLAETSRAAAAGGPLASVALLPARDGVRQSGDVIVLPEVRP
jgi:hypothetical protein